MIESSLIVESKKQRKVNNMSRDRSQLYPDYSAYIEEIEKKGISVELLQKIIQRHEPNAIYNRSLYDRYRTIEGGVPIFNRSPRFEEDKPINNRINNDFFSEIVDFKTGYFAGNPISYGYSKSEEAENVTGGESAVDIATKAITDFTTRSNMFGVDMETTKFASIYGYSGRLFYIELSFLPLFLLGLISCCLPILWIYPYMEAVKANFYLDLMKKRGSSTKKEQPGTN